MSESVAFRWVDIEGFRGFHLRQRINLDASAVILVGPNGTGKTSFFDALQWLLLGSLERLERLRTRRNTEHIVNQYRGSAPAIVEAELELRGKLVVLRRQGRFGDGLLEWSSEDEELSGDVAERRLREALMARPWEDIRRLLTTSALLQQDVIREVLEDKPAERYEQLAALLGLDDMSAFDAAARKRATRLASSAKEARASVHDAQRTADDLRARLAELNSRHRLDADVAEARDRLLRRLDGTTDLVRVRLAPRTATDAALIRGEAQTCGERLTQLLDSAAVLDEGAAVVANPSADEIQITETEAASASDLVGSAEREHAEAITAVAAVRERSSAMARLAAEAVDLLGPVCPVCEQTINASDVKRHLEEVMVFSTGSDELSRAAEKERHAKEQRDVARKRLADAQARLTTLQARRESSLELQRRRSEWQTLVSEFPAGDVQSLEFGELSAIHSGAIDTIRATRDALRVVWSVAVDLVSVLRVDSGERELADLRGSLARAEEALKEAGERASLASSQEAAGRGFADATTRSVTAVTERRFRKLAPVVQDIYARLDPHPSFRTLDFDLGVYNRRGIASPVVVDEDLAVRADPLIVFSSSQANVTALSYFLAVGWAAGEDALPFVMLDDPLQSMDDINALGFADLCRHIRRQRQMLVSTHDRRLGALLERKLAPRSSEERTRIVEFRAWSRDGPDIEQRTVDSQAADGRLRSVVATAST